MSRVGTHVTHCCVYHGCKYGDMSGAPCPVATGAIEQKYPCEQCDWAKQEYEEAESLRWFVPKESK